MEYDIVRGFKNFSGKFSVIEKNMFEFHKIKVNNIKIIYVLVIYFYIFIYKKMNFWIILLIIVSVVVTISTIIKNWDDIVDVLGSLFRIVCIIICIISVLAFGVWFLAL